MQKEQFQQIQLALPALRGALSLLAVCFSEPVSQICPGIFVLITMPLQSVCDFGNGEWLRGRWADDRIGYWLKT